MQARGLKQTSRDKILETKKSRLMQARGLKLLVKLNNCPLV